LCVLSARLQPVNLSACSGRIVGRLVSGLAVAAED
jgi:hypothetical protein